MTILLSWGRRAGRSRNQFSSDLPYVHAVIDSGATTSCTDALSRLTKVRPCSEVFGDAGGMLAQARSMVDLVASAHTADGQLVSVRFTNVRHVPQYKFTLLSTTQLWSEQRVDARFADIRSLVLTKGIDSSVEG